MSTIFWRSTLLCFAAVAAAPLATAQTVTLDTSVGDIVVQLDAAKAPATVENFVQYVNAGHYNGTVFHRVIDGFMIPGGGMTADGKPRPTRAPIALEARNGLSNQRGTIAMARTSVPNSATSQFFINVVDNIGKLDAPRPDGHGYAVFGKVVSGMDVVDKIRVVPTNGRDAPLQPIVIEKATVEKSK